MTGKTKLIIMSGLPGSGKSTTAHQIRERDKSFIIVSSDAWRKKLYGDESYQINNSLIFAKAYDEAATALKAGKNVIFDATQLSVMERKNTIKKIGIFADEIECIFMDTPLKSCLERNKARARVVPDEVFTRMLDRTKAPSKKEGFDEITFM